MPSKFLPSVFEIQGIEGRDECGLLFPFLEGIQQNDGKNGRKEGWVGENGECFGNGWESFNSGFVTNETEVMDVLKWQKQIPTKERSNVFLKFPFTLLMINPSLLDLTNISDGPLPISLPSFPFGITERNCLGDCFCFCKCAMESRTEKARIGAQKHQIGKFDNFPTKEWGGFAFLSWNVNQMPKQ